jgi:TP901 family phage tail tape measure protein
MTVLEDLVVKLSADVKSLQDGMKVATDAVNSASDNINKSLKNTETQSKSAFDNIKTGILAVFGGNLISSLGGKFIGVMNDAFQSARQLSRGIAEINSVLPDNAKLTKDATDQLIKLSSQYGTDASTQAKAYYDIVTSGVEGAQNQMKLLTQANETATAGLISVGESVKILSVYLDAYSKAGYDAARISDILFKSALTGGLTFEKMASSIQNLIPTAKTANISLEELSTALGFLAKQGQSAETSSAQLEAMMKAIINPTAEAADFAKRLGIEFDSNALKSKGLTAVLEQVIKATGGNVDAISVLFPKMIATNGVVAIAEGGFKNLSKAMADNAGYMGATSRAADEVKKSMDFELKQVESEVKNLAMGFTIFLLPAIKAAIDIAKDALLGFQRLRDGIANFIDPKYEDLDDVVDKIKSTRSEINNLIEVQNNLKAQQNLLGGRDVEIENNRKKIAELKADYIELQSIYKEMAKEEGAVAPERAPALKGPGGEEIPGTAGAALESPEKKGPDPILKAEMDAQAERLKIKQDLAAQEIALDQENLKAQQDNLDAAHELKLISDEEYYAAKSEFNQEQFNLEDEQNIIKFETEMEKLQAEYEQRMISHEDFLNGKLALEEAAQNKHDALAQKAKLTQDQIDKKKRDKEKEESEKKLNAMQTTFSTIATLSSSHNKALATIGKAAGIADATINTYKGINQALGAFPPPYSFIMAGLVGAAGFANVASIAGVGFEKGITEIPSGYKNDSFPAGLSSGERVVDADTNTDLKEFLRSGDGGGKSTVEIAFKGDALELLEYQLTDRWDKGVSRLRLKGIA